MHYLRPTLFPLCVTYFRMKTTIFDIAHVSSSGSPILDSLPRHMSVLLPRVTVESGDNLSRNYYHMAT